MEPKLLNKIETALRPSVARNDIVFNWMDNPSVQKLLDTIASIIADEYIQIAKQNPDTFSNTGGPK
ncbi:MAG: hypothetical protein KJ706_05845 [Candidatus Omnitrophica bacterium]|nr:hypothetical protein [Candidatus Omnitrophota bacterium]